jgi:hypothetical protein
MNRIASWILAQFLLLFTAKGVPPVLNYAGQVAVNGEAFDGNGLFKFALVNADGTTTFWSNDGTSVDGSQPQASVSVSVSGGLYAVLLGNSAQPGMAAIDPAVFAQRNDAKLRVWFSNGVNGFQQLSPDRPFASVPYAFSAGTAETAGSAPIANGAVNLDMLSQDVKTQINAPISRSRLTQEVVADINATIGLDRLSSEIISKLEQNATITNGSVTGSKMADGAITTDKLNEQILKYLKPEITSQPQAQTVYGDSNVSFSVTAEGKYLTYQWKRDSLDLAGETNATLTITDANATLHDGNYSVVVSNDFGSVESDLTEVIVKDAILNGLVGWWKFDESSGTIAYDSSGNGFNGTLTGGPTRTTGKIGGAINFDGINDYINIVNFYGVTGNNPRTVSAWIKTPLNSSNDKKVVEWGRCCSSGQIWSLGVTQNGRVRTDAVGSKYSSSVISNNAWTFIANVFPLSKTKVESTKNFINGIFSSGTSDNNININTKSDNNVLIGKGLANNKRWFDGLIDDVRIYDRALSAEEVQALYNLGQ